jgi:hypothetical protein
MDEEVTATQAAALTGFSERTIRRKIAAGELRARRIAPNRFAIAVEDLPRRRGAQAPAVRLEALEQRLEALEQRVNRLEGWPQAGAEDPEPGRDAQTQPEEAVPVVSLRDLLAQLTLEVERLSPLLTIGDVGGDDDAHAAPHTNGAAPGRRRLVSRHGRRT